MQFSGICKLFGGQKCSPVFLRPRRRCCSGVRAIVEGAIVYLKYFQKSKTAFRLNRVANTSSVEDREKTYKTCLWKYIRFVAFSSKNILNEMELTNIPYRPVGDIIIST